MVRAGAAPDAAWAAAGVRAREGVPDRAALERAGADPQAAAALVAAGRLVLRAGAPPGPVLDAVAGALDAQERADAARRAALAGPAASARLLAWLPAIGPVLGLAVGVDPAAAWSGGLRWVVLLGVLAAIVGRAWSAALVRAAARVGEDAPAGSDSRAGVGPARGERIRAGRTRAGRSRAERTRAEPTQAGPERWGARWGLAAGSAAGPPVEVPVPVLLELLAAASAAGASVPGALRAVGAAARGVRGAALERAAVRLARGWPWPATWRDAPAELAVVAAALRPAWSGGAAPTGLLRAAARRVQEAREARAAEAAGRLGVRLLGPLAACHLPAFVLVGLVPVLASLARSTFAA